MDRLNQNVLVLNQNYEPIGVCNVKRAVILVYLGKADIVEKNGSDIRAVAVNVPFPSIVRLHVYIYRPYQAVLLSRKNILLRDRYTCQYCGKKTSPLTVDHIIPRQYGGKHSWENLTCACLRCNNLKGNQTPEQAGMQLSRQPKKPSHLFFLQSHMVNPKENWRRYLFLDS
ncbi:MAG: HNH endonuclease [Calditrichales bacterium]|nr:MAG: HNH endonuclease [Calditrichales bacterium]